MVVWTGTVSCKIQAIFDECVSTAGAKKPAIQNLFEAVGAQRASTTVSESTFYIEPASLFRICRVHAWHKACSVEGSTEGETMAPSLQFVCKVETVRLALTTMVARRSGDREAMTTGTVDVGAESAAAS